VYRSLLHLSWIDKLVDNIKTIFVDLYGDQLRKPHTTVVECHFDEYFDQQMRELEKSTSNRETRAIGSSALTKEASVGDSYRDEPPPLPGFLARGNCSRNVTMLVLISPARPVEEQQRPHIDRFHPNRHTGYVTTIHPIKSHYYCERRSGRKDIQTRPKSGSISSKRFFRR
jgi:hypothetical protein